MTTQPGPSNRGFSLLEMVVVIGVIAIIVGLVLPKYRSQKSALESVSKETLSLFQLASQQAHSMQDSVIVSINRTAERIQSFQVIDFINKNNPTDNIIATFVPNITVLVTSNTPLDAIIFSPTTDVKGVLGGSDILLTVPIHFFMSSSVSSSRNITIFPKSSRAILN